MPPPVRVLTPLGWYAIGSVFCAAAAPILGTIVLQREMTANEVYHSTLGCLLGPPGWLLANLLFPPTAAIPGFSPGTLRHLPPRPEVGGQNSVPSSRAGGFVPGEVLIEIRAGATPQQIAYLFNRLHLTQLAVQSFTLTGRTVRLLHIVGRRSVRAVLLALRRYAIVGAAQPNYLFVVQQDKPMPSQADGQQYVVAKLHLLQAHRLSEGNGVRVAVIDSQIALHHPDLTGAFIGEDNVLGTPAVPHDHGTAMAGAIVAHGKLVGVAPKARILAVRAFGGSGQSAQGTTFNILKGLDWAAAQGARVVNMSFAGPRDPMLSDMLAKAYARGMVLVAAVGNAGPRTRPLYPAADRHVIGVTATDDHDKLLTQANRGPQVTLAAPGVDILADAPDAGYQITTGTSIAAAHVSGVVALMLARDPRLTPAQVRRALIRAAHKIPDRRSRDVGAGEIDALSAVEEFSRAEK
jgi:subtilisin family serine protease